MFILRILLITTIIIFSLKVFHKYLISSANQNVDIVYFHDTGQKWIIISDAMHDILTWIIK